MRRHGGVRLLAAAGMIAVAAGVTALPASRAAAGTPGMVLGHVPRAVAPTSASIVIGQDAQDKGYSTKTVTISQGGDLSVVNLDSIQHTVTSVAKDGNGNPLFEVFSNAGTTTSIPAASKLAAGTYDFFCSFHPTMTGKLIVEGGSGGTKPTPPSFDQPLKLPKVLTGAHLTIPIARKKVRVLPHGPKTPMWTYAGSYPGPTIRRTAGHATTVTFIDKLPKSDGSFTVHFHGDHHSSASDGQPATHLIRHGARLTYHYPLREKGKPERAAFNFYHDHRMDATSRNNWRGLQGMFITTDKKSKKLNLPAGRYDLPLDIADRSFRSDNRLTNPFPQASMSMVTTGSKAPPGDGTVGNHILVDGRFAPYLNVDTHKYRLRLLNSSNFSSYDFAMSDGRPLIQIGTGSGLLPKPVIRQDVLLGPGQRADVVVDFHGERGKQVELNTVPRSDNSPKGIGTPSAALMQFRVTTKVADTTRIPTHLQSPPKFTAPKKVSATWTFNVAGNQQTGSYWTVNGKPFDPKRVDLKVPLGSKQTWKLTNESSITHYIHLHEEQWHTVSRDGKRPPAWERGLEDTWRLDPGESVEVAAAFTDFTGVFMLHCHMLDHEDHGMMAQFAVVKKKHGKASALPAGYYDDESANPRMSNRPMRSMPMDMSTPKYASAPRPTAFGSWTRRLTRGGAALGLELMLVLTVLVLRHAIHSRPAKA